MTLYLNEGFINETEKKGNKCVPFLIYYISIGEFSMPEPAYPHPIPNPNLVVKNNPQPSDITGLPLLTKFIADVDRWFTDIRVTPACRPLAIDEPGRVLILAKGEEHRVVEVGGAEITVDNSAMVLNGDIPSVGFLHNRWVKRIKTLAQTGNVPPQATLDKQGKTYWAAPKAFDTSRTPAAGGSCNGNYDCTNGTIYINAHVDDGSILVHEYFHTYDGNNDPAFGWHVDEGMTDFFARDASARFKLRYLGNAPYEDGYQAIKQLVDSVGIVVVAKLKFQRPHDWMHKLSPMLNRLDTIISTGVKIRNHEPGIRPLTQSRWNPQPVTVNECLEAIVNIGRNQLGWVHRWPSVQAVKPAKI